ncbi:phytoene/squalene synthase family protein [Brevundimonas goettingensis]|uniref:Phytoene/squalene synthase family protein n=1 Tax=Brevundimonas goettingensis TaxID=2774190 RepID=A0A975BYA7_9CAUL|nr:phytoene/squalene synthase family protein [Brevundimonas goettingensis]QTC89683.1 phytoene/squalene synthase family protein [Brevundimonas goettingensis]
MTDAVLAASKDSIVKGSKSFRSASRLFDPAVREDAWLLYAWCRRCDDEIDGQDHGFGHEELSEKEQRRRLKSLYSQTRAALAGQPMDDQTFAAFQRVALRHHLPERWPLDLLDGFAMDVEHREYRTLDDVMAYCWHVAGVVGVMMARVMGVFDAQVLRRAQDLGLAFQLTNISRDVVEDAENGRVYLPADWLVEAGLEPTPEAVADPKNREAVHAVTARLLAVAEPYYDSARIGLRGLPFRSSMAIAAARGVYREIGRKVIRSGPGVWKHRVSVGKPMKLWLFGRSVLIAVWTRALDRGRTPPPRPEMWTRV